MTTHQLLCGDVRKIQPTLPSESVHLIVTSPPYYAYKGYSNSEDDIENSKTYEDYISSMDIIIKEWYRLLTPNSRCCIVIDDKHTNLKTEGINRNRGTHARLITIAEKHGFIYKDLVIWAKPHTSHASGGAGKLLGSYPYPPNIPLVNWFEYILIFHKEGKRKMLQEIKEKSKLSMNEFKWASQSIWYIDNHDTYDHPAPFTIEIANRLIRLFSFVGDVVYDPFVGSGTTSYVAKKLGRNSIGCDLNPLYIDMATKRLARLDGSIEQNVKPVSVSIAL